MAFLELPLLLLLFMMIGGLGNGMAHGSARIGSTVCRVASKQISNRSKQ